MLRIVVSFLVVLSLTGVLAAPAEARVGRAIGVAKAAKRKHDPAQMFRRIDTNNDGKISLAEFTAHHNGEKAEHLFKRMDKDNDGFVTPAEFANAMHHRKDNKK